MKKTAIVTGGSRGIGLAIVRQLGLDGYQVVIFSSSPEERYKDTLQSLKDQNITYHFVQGNLGDHDDRLRLVEETVQTFGSIEVLINNAGVAPKERADLLEMSEESFDYVVGINTKGTMFLTQEVAKQMLKQDVKEGQRRGTIVNISSCSSVVSSTNRGEYCISKAGVSMLTTLYADRLADDQIYVYEVRPGVIATDMTAKVEDKYNKLIEKGEFPIARWGKPEDIAGVVSAFCSDKFTYTTGNYIDVDGGFHIRRL